MPGIDLVPVCIVLFFVAIVADLVLNRRVWTFVLGLSAILLVVVLALLVENSATGKVGLGADTTPYGVLAGMFVAIVLGIGARYVFELKTGAFSWLDLVKPIMISPIVLLPLIGSIQAATGELTGMQIVMFALLAFQNGFFWKAVLSGAKPPAHKARETR